MHGVIPPPPLWQGRPPRQGRPPCTVHAGRYSQQAGSMHPTGIQFLFFLNVALVILVCVNIAISWQLLRFNSLKKHFPQIYRLKRFENGLGKKFPDLNYFSWFWLKTPCFSLIFLTGKSLQIFPWFPRIPWSVGTLRKILHFNKARSHCDGNIIFLQIFFCALVSLQCEHLHLLPWDPFFFCRCHHNWEQNPFQDDIKIMKIMPLPQ